MKEYKPYIIYTFENKGGGSAQSVRAKPVPGQGLNELMHVSCSKSMRLNNPVASYIKIDAKLAKRKGENEYLYAPSHFDYEIISKQEALDFIRNSYQAFCAEGK